MFFSGAPYFILGALSQGRLRLVVSTEILDEYRRVGERLARKHTGVDVGSFLALIERMAETVPAPNLPEPLCVDPADDMFFACAFAAGCQVIISGDKHLLRANGYRGVEVLRPRAFVEKYLGPAASPPSSA